MFWSGNGITHYYDRSPFALRPSRNCINISARLHCSVRNLVMAFSDIKTEAARINMVSLFLVEIGISKLMMVFCVAHCALAVSLFFAIDHGHPIDKIRFFAAAAFDA